MGTVKNVPPQEAELNYNKDFLTFVAKQARTENPEATNAEVAELYSQYEDKPDEFIANAYQKNLGKEIPLDLLRSTVEDLGFAKDVDYLDNIDYSLGDYDKLVDELDTVDNSQFLNTTEDKYISKYATRGGNPMARQSMRDQFTKMKQEHLDLDAELDKQVEKTNFEVLSVEDVVAKVNKEEKKKKGPEALYFSTKNYLEKYVDLIDRKAKMYASRIDIPAEKIVVDNILAGLPIDQIDMASLGNEFSGDFLNFIDATQKIAEQEKVIDDYFKINLSQKIGNDERGLSLIPGEGEVSVDDALLNTRNKMQAEREESQAFIRFRDLPFSAPGGEDPVPSVTKTFMTGLVDNVTKGVRMVTDLFDYRDEEKILDSANKSGYYVPEHKEALQEFARTYASREAKSLEATVRRSDYSAPFYEEYVDVDGVKIGLDSKGDYSRVIREGGRSGLELTPEESKAINKYNSNKSLYLKNKDTAFNPKSLIATTGDAAFNMIPMLAASALTGGSMTASVLAMAAVSVGDNYEKQLERSGSTINAMSYAAFQTGIESFSESALGPIGAKFGKAMANTTKSAIRRSAQKALDEGKLLPNFDFTKSFFGHLQSSVREEVFEEVGVLFASAAIDGLYGNDVNITANDLYTTVLSTMFVSGPIGSVTSSQLANRDYKESIIASAANYDKFNSLIAERVASGKMTQEEANTKVGIIDRVRENNDYVNRILKGANIDKKDKEGLERLILDLAIEGKDLDSFREAIDPLLNQLIRKSKPAADAKKPSADPPTGDPPVDPADPATKQTPLTKDGAKKTPPKSKEDIELEEELFEGIDDDIEDAEVVEDPTAEEEVVQDDGTVVSPSPDSTGPAATEGVTEVTPTPETAEATIEDMNTSVFQNDNYQTGATFYDVFNLDENLGQESETVVTDSENNQGVLKVDEGGKVTFETDTKIEELGNIEQIYDTPLEDLGYAPLPDITVKSDKGAIRVGGNNYVSRYSDPTGAIEYDAEGNVVAVDLEKRTVTGGYGGVKGNVSYESVRFTGKMAEDLSLILLNKELETNEQKRAEFDEFAEETGLLDEIEANEEEGPVDGGEEVPAVEAEPTGPAIGSDQNIGDQPDGGDGPISGDEPAGGTTTTEPTGPADTTAEPTPSTTATSTREGQRGPVRRRRRGDGKRTVTTRISDRGNEDTFTYNPGRKRWIRSNGTALSINESQRVQAAYEQSKIDSDNLATSRTTVLGDPVLSLPAKQGVREQMKFTASGLKMLKKIDKRLHSFVASSLDFFNDIPVYVYGANSDFDSLDSNNSVVYKDGAIHINAASFSYESFIEAVSDYFNDRLKGKFNKLLLERLKLNEDIGEVADLPLEDVITDTDQEPNQPALFLRNQWKKATKLIGNARSYVSPTGQRYQVVYMVVDAKDVHASHNEESFGTTKGYPQNEDGSTPNDRNYSADKAAQSEVVKMGLNFDERAIDNPPIVTPDGIVISGNNRLMSRKRAGKSGQDQKYYIPSLQRRAESFGVKGDFSSFENPTLVMALVSPVPYTVDSYASFNAQETKSKSNTDKKRSYSNKITDITRKGIADRIKTVGSVAQYYVRYAREFINLMIKDGIIGSQQVNDYIENQGDKEGLTTEGKQLVSDVLFSSIVDDSQVGLDRKPGMITYFDTIKDAFLSLSENVGKDQNGNIRKPLTRAIALLNDYVNLKQSKGASEVSLLSVAGEYQMLGDDYGPVEKYLAWAITKGVTKFDGIISAINTSVSSTNISMFDGKTRSYKDAVADLIVAEIAAIERQMQLGTDKKSLALDLAYLKMLSPEGFSRIDDQFDETVLSIESDPTPEVTQAYEEAVSDVFRQLGIETRGLDVDAKQLFDQFRNGTKVIRDPDDVLDNITMLQETGRLEVGPKAIYDQFKDDFVEMEIELGHIYDAMDYEQVFDDETHNPELVDTVLAGQDQTSSSNLGLNELIKSFSDAIIKAFGFDLGKSLVLANGIMNPTIETIEHLTNAYNWSPKEIRLIRERFPAMEIGDFHMAYMNAIAAGTDTDLFSGFETFATEVLQEARNSNIKLPLQYDLLAERLGIYDSDDFRVGETYLYEDQEYVVTGSEIHGGERVYILKNENETLIEVPEGDTELSSLLEKKQFNPLGVETVTDALAELSPSTEIVFVDQAYMSQRFGRGYSGFYDNVNDKIYVNTDSRNPPMTLAHESVHALLQSKYAENPEIIVELANTIASVLRTGTQAEMALYERVMSHTNNYTEELAQRAGVDFDTLLAHEFLAELVAIMSTDASRISQPKTKQIIQAIVDFITNKLGLSVPLDINDIDGAIAFVNGIADSFVQGEVVNYKDYKTSPMQFEQETKPGFFSIDPKHTFTGERGNGKIVDVYMKTQRGKVASFSARVFGQGKNPVSGKRTVGLEVMYMVDGKPHFEPRVLYNAEEFYLDKDGDLMITSFEKALHGKVYSDKQITLLQRILGNSKGLSPKEVYTRSRQRLIRNGITLSDVINYQEKHSDTVFEGDRAEFIDLGSRYQDSVKRFLVKLNDPEFDDVVLMNKDSFRKWSQTNEQIRELYEEEMSQIVSEYDAVSYFETLLELEQTATAKELPFVWLLYSGLTTELNRFDNKTKALQALARMADLSSMWSQLGRVQQAALNPNMASRKDLAAINDKMTMMDYEAARDNVISDDSDIKVGQMVDELSEATKFTEEDIDTIKKGLEGVIDDIANQNDIDRQKYRDLLAKIYGTDPTTGFPRLEGDDLTNFYEFIDEAFNEANGITNPIGVVYRNAVRIQKLRNPNKYKNNDVFAYNDFLAQNELVLTYLGNKIITRNKQDFLERVKDKNASDVVKATLVKEYNKVVGSKEKMVTNALDATRLIYQNKIEGLKIIRRLRQELEFSIKFADTEADRLNYLGELRDVNQLMLNLGIESEQEKNGNSARFTMLSREQILGAVNYGLTSAKISELEALGIRIPEDADPKDFKKLAIEFLIREAGKERNMSVRNLSEKIVTKMGLDPTEATDLANRIHEIYTNELLEQKASFLEKALAVRIKNTKSKSSRLSKMLDLLKVGALTQDKYIEAFASKFELRKLTDKNVKELSSLIQGIQRSTDQKEIDDLYLQLNSRLRSLSSSPFQRAMRWITALRFTALLSGINTFFVSFFSSTALIHVEAALAQGQLVKRGGAKEFKRYRKENPEFFHRAAIRSAMDALRRGATKLTQQDIPDEAYSAFDLWMNKYIESQIGLFNDIKDLKIGKILNGFMPEVGVNTKDTIVKNANKYLVNGVLASAMIMPAIMVRTLQAIDVFWNVRYIEKFAFLEAMDKTTNAGFDQNSEEFFKNVYDLMGVNDTFDKQVANQIELADNSGRTLTGLDLALMKKKVALDLRDETIKEQARDRALTAAVMNTDVPGFATGILGNLLTIPQRMSRSDDGLISLTGHVLEHTLRLTLFPIVKTVLGAAYLAYNYNIVSLAVNGLLTKLTNVDKISYDIISGKLKLNGQTLDEIALEQDGKFSYGDLFNKRSAQSQILKANQKSKVEKEAFISRAVIGSSLMLALFAAAFKPSRDEEDNLVFKKRDGLWKYLKITADGTGDYFENKNLYGPDFKESTVSFMGWHARWTELPAAPSIGLVGILGDKIELNGSVSVGEALRNSMFNSMTYAYGEGFDIGVSQMGRYIRRTFDYIEAESEVKDALTDAQKRKAERDLDRSVNNMSKLFADNLRSQSFPNFYRQLKRMEKGATGKPLRNTYGDSFTETFMLTLQKDIPFLDDRLEPRLDIAGFEIPSNLDVYIMPDRYEDAFSNFLKNREGHTTVNVLEETKSLWNQQDLYRIRGTASNVRKKGFYLSNESRELLYEKWSELFNEEIERKNDMLMKMSDGDRGDAVIKIAEGISKKGQFIYWKNQLRTRK
jgi:hypothetical protein